MTLKPFSLTLNTGNLTMVHTVHAKSRDDAFRIMLTWVIPSYHPW